jgi:hypothetical protein
MLVFLLMLLVCPTDETSLAQVEPQAVSRTTIPRAELVYDRPADTPDAGQPIGNGRMGTMVWTSPDAVQLQINRADVFPVNRDHIGQRGGATDYCGGIARVMIGIGGQAFAPSENQFQQRLSLDNAECTIKGAGVQVRTFVSARSDVLVMEIDDQRPAPEAVKITVSMLRSPEVVAGDHVATTNFADDRERIALLQRFRRFTSESPAESRLRSKRRPPPVGRWSCPQQRANGWCS